MDIKIGDKIIVSPRISKTGCVLIVGVQPNGRNLNKGWNWDYIGVPYDNQTKKAINEPLKLQRVDVCP